METARRAFSNGPREFTKKVERARACISSSSPSSFVAARDGVSRTSRVLRTIAQTSVAARLLLCRIPFIAVVAFEQQLFRTPSVARFPVRRAPACFRLRDRCLTLSLVLIFAVSFFVFVVFRGPTTWTCLYP